MRVYLRNTKHKTYAAAETAADMTISVRQVAILQRQLCPDGCCYELDETGAYPVQTTYYWRGGRQVVYLYGVFQAEEIQAIVDRLELTHEELAWYLRVPKTEAGAFVRGESMLPPSAAERFKVLRVLTAPKGYQKLKRYWL